MGESRIKLVPFKEEHIANTVEWVNDEEIIRLIDRSSEVVTLEGCNDWFENIEKDDAKVMFAILTSDGLHIGNCGLFEVSERSKKAKLWIYIGDKSLWGKGLGREALQELLDYGFNKMSLNKIYLYVVANNTRAQNLYESAGFVKEGEFKEDTFLGGEFMDTVYYGILKEKYKKRSS